MMRQKMEKFFRFEVVSQFATNRPYTALFYVVNRSNSRERKNWFGRLCNSLRISRPTRFDLSRKKISEVFLNRFKNRYTDSSYGSVLTLEKMANPFCDSKREIAFDNSMT